MVRHRPGVAVDAIMAEAGDQTFVLGDATSSRMIHLFSASDPAEFLRERKGPGEELARSALSDLPKDCVLAPDESGLVLRRWLSMLEKRISELCQKESKQFWLHLTRRIRPDPKALGMSPATTWLARATLNLAILKYGLDDGRPFVKVPAAADVREWMFGEEDNAEIQESEPSAEPAFLLPKTLTRMDCVTAYQLEELAYQFCLVAAGLRRAWKGGRLRLQDGVAQGVELDSTTEHLVKLYDTRVAKYNTVSSGFGLVADLGELLERRGPGNRISDAWLLWIPVWNLEGRDVARLFEERSEGPFVSNYLLLPSTMEPWYRCARLFSKEIRAIWGVSPEQIACFLVASSRRHYLIWRQDIRLRYALWQRGYVVIEAERYAREVAAFYRECYSEMFGETKSPRAAARETAEVLAAITYKEADFEKIDLWTRSGAKVVHPVGEGYHLDYSMLPVFLAHVLRGIPVTGGPPAVAKGIEFEQQARDIIETLVPGIELWGAHRVLKFHDGSERELDLGIVLGEVMLVCECRSHAVPPSFDRGEPDALWEREQKLGAAVAKADSLSQKLAGHPKGRNFALPDGVRFVIPCVLTPFAEYLPEKSSTFFFDDGNWPRVCVPEEFAEFLKQPGGANFLHGPTVHTVARN